MHAQRATRPKELRDGHISFPTPRSKRRRNRRFRRRIDEIFLVATLPSFQAPLQELLHGFVHEHGGVLDLSRRSSRLNVVVVVVVVSVRRRRERR